MKLAIIGLGKLGLPLSLVFAKAGFEVIGIDVSKAKIDQIKEKYTQKSPEPQVTEYLQKYGDNLTLTTDYQNLEDVPVIIVITQSPSLPDGLFNVSYVEQAVDDIHKINKNALIVISSTTNIGIIDNLAIKHNRICYNPEMIRQGSIIYDFENPNYVIIGAYNEQDGKTLADIWGKVHNKTIYYVTPLEAELLKISLNVSFTLGITFANIIGELCEKFNADANAILDIIYKDRRDYKPGLGFMGPCFPRDVQVFKKLSIENSVESGFLFSILLTELNNYIVDVYTTKLKYHAKKKIGFLGIAYKSNVPYLHESQPVKIIQQLLNDPHESGYEIFIFDPTAEENGKKILINENIHFCSTLEQCLENSELLFIGTPNYSQIQSSKPIVNPWVSEKLH